jgi:hypothetical protein
MTGKMTCAGTPSGSRMLLIRRPSMGRSSKEVPMSILGGLDVHRRQITFDWVDHDTGEVGRGRTA